MKDIFVGLNEAGINYVLDRGEETIPIYNAVGNKVGERKEKRTIPRGVMKRYAMLQGAHGDLCAMFSYDIMGHTIKEKLQLIRDDKYFFALEDQRGFWLGESLWTEEEIQLSIYR